jgi:hypothetical protein
LNASQLSSPSISFPREASTGAVPNAKGARGVPEIAPRQSAGVVKEEKVAAVATGSGLVWKGSSWESGPGGVDRERACLARQGGEDRPGGGEGKGAA